MTGLDDWSYAKDWAPEQIAYASAAELAAGRLSAAGPVAAG